MASKDNKAGTQNFDHHNSTYEGFIRFSVIGTVAVLNFVLCLMLHTFGDGFFVKWLAGVGGIFATLVATGIGIAVKSASWRPNGIIFVGLGLLAILAFAG